MRKTSKTQTEFVIVWGGEFNLGGKFPPLKGLKKTLCSLLLCQTQTQTTAAVQIVARIEVASPV